MTSQLKKNNKNVPNAYDMDDDERNELEKFLKLHLGIDSDKNNKSDDLQSKDKNNKSNKIVVSSSRNKKWKFFSPKPAPWFVPEEIKPLSQKNNCEPLDLLPFTTTELYGLRMHRMLWMEEYRLELEMRQYDIQDVVIDISIDDYLVIPVKGLAENRPSLVPGDQAKIYISHSNSFVSHEHRHDIGTNKDLGGVVDRIGEVVVYVSRYDRRIIDKIKSRFKFDIEFYPTRTPFRRTHHAVECCFNSQRRLDSLFITNEDCQQSHPQLNHSHNSREKLREFHLRDESEKPKLNELGEDIMSRHKSQLTLKDQENFEELSKGIQNMQLQQDSMSNLQSKLIILERKRLDMGKNLQNIGLKLSKMRKEKKKHVEEQHKIEKLLAEEMTKLVDGLELELEEIVQETIIQLKNRLKMKQLFLKEHKMQTNRLKSEHARVYNKIPQIEKELKENQELHEKEQKKQQDEQRKQLKLQSKLKSQEKQKNKQNGVNSNSSPQHNNSFNDYEQIDECNQQWKTATTKRTKRKLNLLINIDERSSLSLFNAGLNIEQQMAVKHIMRASCRPSPYIVYGPPGTGKSCTLVEAILQIHCTYKRNAKILVCCNSNSGTDLLASRLLKSGQVDERVLLRLSARYRMEYGVPDDLRHVTFELANLPKNFHKIYPILVTTCIQSGCLFEDIDTRDGFYDFVFVDEAGRATEPESLIPLSLLKPDGLLVLAGDPHQLGPVVISKIAVKCGLNGSLLERLCRTCEPYQRFLRPQLLINQHSKTETGEEQLSHTIRDPKFIMKLVRNYRSDERLMSISNSLFYNNELKFFLPTPEKCFSVLNVKFPAIFHAVRGVDQRERSNPSWFNSEEIRKVTRYMKKLCCKEVRFSGDQIGILTPYRCQRDKIRQRIEDDLPIAQDCKISTIEEAQGEEREIIIISTVRSAKEKNLDFDRKFNLGFLFTPKRFNTAISRAKWIIIVVGNPDVLKADPCWSEYIKMCKLNHTYFDDKQK